VPLGYANLTVLFDESGRNRVEWILTSEGVFEAWAIVDGVSSRIDNHKLGTKSPNPTIGDCSPRGRLPVHVEWPNGDAENRKESSP